MASVRSFAADPAQRQQVINQLIADPAYAVGFKGSDTAAGRIIDTLGADGLKLYHRRQGREAGGLRRPALEVVDPAGPRPRRPPGLRQDHVGDPGPGRQRRRGGPAPGLAERHAVGEPRDPRGRRPPRRRSSAGPRSAAPPYKPLVIRGLAVAALAALGSAGDDRLALIEAVMAEPASAMCLNMAKLNLYQCLAVAKPHYEDVFCLGQHIMIDTGACVIKASGRDALRAPPRPSRNRWSRRSRWPRRPPPRPRRRAKRLYSLLFRRTLDGRPLHRAAVLCMERDPKNADRARQSGLVRRFRISRARGSPERQDMAEIILNVELRDRGRHRRFARNPPPGPGPRRAVRRQQAPVNIAVKVNEFRKALYTGKLLGHLVTLQARQRQAIGHRQGRAVPPRHRRCRCTSTCTASTSTS